MAILDAQGNAIVTERKVGLQIVILDQKPGRAGAEKAVMGFELDSNSPHDIGALLQKIGQAVVGRLHDIGFMDKSPAEPNTNTGYSSTVTGGDVVEEESV